MHIDLQSEQNLKSTLSDGTNAAAKRSPNAIWRLFRSLRSAAIRRPIELDVLAAYREWACNYPAHAHNALMRAEERAMLDLLPAPRGKFVLDLACGTGRYAHLLNERGTACVIATDLSLEMLMRANKCDGHFIQADLNRLPITPNSFDLVTCGLALGHIENLHLAVAEISRLLKHGGILLYSDFHPLGYLAGWRREFNGHDGKRYSVRHHPHLYSVHDAACRAAGLQITALREPLIGSDIIEEFPGSKDIYRLWKGWPAVLVIRAEKMT